MSELLAAMNALITWNALFLFFLVKHFTAVELYVTSDRKGKNIVLRWCDTSTSYTIDTHELRLVIMKISGQA